MPDTITLQDNTFRLHITESQIQDAVKQIADKINQDYKGKSPIMIPILNGSFMFASDLLKQLTIQCEISFIKASSYQGTSSSGEFKSLIGINEDMSGRDIIILEDIIDTGYTLSQIIPSIKNLNPSSVRIATLLFKPEAFKADINIDYIGLEIANHFIVGYGLDYNGLGRNLKEIYQVI